MSKQPLIVGLSDGKYTFLCKRCGDRFTPSIPISINDYCQKLKEFSQQHWAIALLQSIQNTLQSPETPWQRREAIAQSVLTLLCGKEAESKAG